MNTHQTNGAHSHTSYRKLLEPHVYVDVDTRAAMDHIPRQTPQCAPDTLVPRAGDASQGENIRDSEELMHTVSEIR